MDLFLSDTKPPLNVQDEDLTPDMTSPPPERFGITPVVLTLIRCDIAEFFRKITPQSSYDLYWDKITSSYLTVEEKDKLINQIEDLLERKYVRYCDLSDPLHFFASILARSALCKMRLFAHNPRQFADRGIKLPQKDRDVIWTNGMKLLEYGNIMHSNPTMKKFTWQVGTNYLWDTLLYILIETRHRKTGPDVDRAWQLIDCVFKNYPQIFQEATDALYVALGNWTIQVWDDCTAARKADGLPDPPEPDFIASIRRCRRPQTQTSSQENGQFNHGREIGNYTAAHNQSQILGIDENHINEFDSLQSYNFSNLLSFDLEPSEWEQWERLLAGQGV